MARNMRNTAGRSITVGRGLGRGDKAMTAKQILQKKGAFKAEMDRMMPREQSDALWQKGEERLDRILQRYSSLPKGMQIHTRGRIFPAAAIYLTLKDELGQEKAYKLRRNSGS